MPRMSKVQAQHVLSALSPGAVSVLKVMEKIIGPARVPIEAIQEIEQKGLGLHMENLLDPSHQRVFVLTVNGKKVAKQIER